MRISEKHKQPQSIIYADGQHYYCNRCRGHQFDYGGQAEHQEWDDSEPWYADIFRCIGCQNIFEIAEGELPGYRGPIVAACSLCGTAPVEWRVEYPQDRKQLCTLCKEALEMELSDSLGRAWMDESVTFTKVTPAREEG